MVVYYASACDVSFRDFCDFFELHWRAGDLDSFIRHRQLSDLARARTAPRNQVPL